MLTEKRAGSMVKGGVAQLRLAGITNPALEAELLLAQVLKLDRTALHRESQQPLKPKEIRGFQRLIERRARHEPLAYITGQREFWSLEFKVNRRVLIPRPETESLVEAAIEIASALASDETVNILELGTGCGAIAVALAKEIKNCQIWATDRSDQVLAVAQRNAARHMVAQKIYFLKGDLFQPVLGYSSFFNLVVSNPPYVPTDEIGKLEPEIWLYEPKAALNGGKDGLKFHRRLIKAGPGFLRPGGTLILEIGAGQKEAVARMLGQSGCFSSVRFRTDLAGNFRVALATLDKSRR